LAAILVLGGGFFAYMTFMAPEPAPPPPPVTKKAPPVAPAPAATPIDMAKEAAAAATANAQAPAAATTEPAPPTSGDPIGDKAAATLSTVPTATALSPGLVATTDLEAAAEATPAFRSFVANAKVSGAGIMQGTPRAFINDRLTRGGEMVDPGLGVTFETIDAERRLLIFKDRSGAIVSRKY